MLIKCWPSWFCDILIEDTETLPNSWCSIRMRFLEFMHSLASCRMLQWNSANAVKYAVHCEPWLQSWLCWGCLTFLLFFSAQADFEERTEGTGLDEFPAKCRKSQARVQKQRMEKQSMQHSVCLILTRESHWKLRKPQVSKLNLELHSCSFIITAVLSKSAEYMST